MKNKQEQEAFNLLKANTKPSKKTESYFTPLNCVIAACALFYSLFPFDFIPDIIPLIGQIDDIGIIGAVGAFIMLKGKK